MNSIEAYLNVEAQLVITQDTHEDIRVEVSAIPITTESDVERILPGFSELFNNVRGRLAPFIPLLDPNFAWPAVFLCDGSDYENYVSRNIADSVSPSHLTEEGPQTGPATYSVFENAIYVPVDRFGTMMCSLNPREQEHAERALTEEYLHAMTTGFRKGVLKTGFLEVDQVDQLRPVPMGIYQWTTTPLPEDAPVTPLILVQEDEQQIRMTENLMTLLIDVLFDDIKIFIAFSYEDGSLTTSILRKEEIREFYSANRYSFAIRAFKVLRSGNLNRIEKDLAKRVRAGHGEQGRTFARILSDLANPSVVISDDVRFP